MKIHTKPKMTLKIQKQTKLMKIFRHTTPLQNMKILKIMKKVIKTKKKVKKKTKRYHLKNILTQREDF